MKAKMNSQWLPISTINFASHLQNLRIKCESIFSCRDKDCCSVKGSVTCYGDKVKNANCPKDQYMLVKIAFYRGLLDTKTCGSDDYSCEVDVTCVVKKQCDGQHECHIAVDDNLFSGDLCPGLSNYLHFKYQCVDTVKPYKEPCIRDVSLSYSSVPYKGVVQITTESGTKNVCWRQRSMWIFAKYAVCRHLGYTRAYYVFDVSNPTNAKDATFSGSINCNHGEEKYLSQCSINVSANESCSGLLYIKCLPAHFLAWYGGFLSRFYRRLEKIRELLLEDKRKFPDSSFSASAFSEGHSASDARISSGSSWCAPVSNDTHYVQVDLRRLYRLSSVVTYGDSTRSKWVATYNLNYTVDLLNWKTVNRMFQGNKNAYGYAAVRSLYHIRTRALRIIPLTYVGEPCMRFDIFGESLVPDKPTNLTVTNITSRSAEISWLDPKDQGRYGTSRFWIKLKKENSQILSINTGKVNEYKMNNLTSYTTYEIFVAAGNRYGFGEETTTSFRTSEEVSGQVSGTNEKDGGSEKYLAGIIVLVILLVISLVIISYFVYQTRLKSQSTEAKQETTNEENKSSHIYDIPVTNNEQANNEQSTYAALKRPGPGEEGDGHVYAHLNQVPQNVYEIQEET